MNNDEIYKNIASMLKQFSENTKSVLKGINIDGYSKTQNILSQYTKGLNITESQMGIKLIDSQVGTELVSQVSKMLHDSYVDSSAISVYPAEMIKTFADLQASTAVMASLNGATSMLKDVQVYFAASNLDGCIKTIQKTLNENLISMPDLAFFKTSNLMRGLKAELTLPSGFATDIRNLNKSSMVRLSDNEAISFRSDDHVFVCNEDNNATATVHEMNAICGAEKVFALVSNEEMFSEDELMKFMSYLDSKPMMAMKNEVGIKIYNLIKDFPFIINFDNDSFYHCRARKAGEAPYVWEQMKKAPYGITYAGRYNEAGQAFFYFADTLDGAENEVKKHMSENDKKEKVLQSFEIGVQGNVKLIDLSMKSMRGLNTFLRYIRFPLGDDSSKRPRVYLIPSFVAECCIEAGIDGIKYYGGQGYSNYVTWNDGYYSLKRCVH